MDLITAVSILGGIVLVPALLFFLAFSLFSLLEGERRACVRSLGMSLLLLLLILLACALPVEVRVWILGLSTGSAVLLLLMLLLSPRPKKTTRIPGRPDRVDERDVIFARFDLQPDSPEFRSYYGRNPDREQPDNEIRKLPDILGSQHMGKNPECFSLAAAEFDLLEHQLRCVDAPSAEPRPSTRTPEINTGFIKRLIRYLGAGSTGVAFLNQDFVYSHVGRGPEPYGQEIQQAHPYAVAFAVEMDLAMIGAAPQAPVIVETGKRYIQAAVISILAAGTIRRLGFSARAHVAGSNYQAMLPPIAWEAGLGELGRLGSLITWKYGPRARLGLLTTDMPLVPDKPIARGIVDFCRKCRKCAECCPSQAIPLGDRVVDNGIERWVIDREACYTFWRQAGTDCAVCLSVCPYSKANNAFHAFIKEFTRISQFGQRLAVWGDDLFYGRKPIRKKDPLWCRSRPG